MMSLTSKDAAASAVKRSTKRVRLACAYATSSVGGSSDSAIRGRHERPGHVKHIGVRGGYCAARVCMDGDLVVCVVIQAFDDINLPSRWPIRTLGIQSGRKMLIF